MENAGSIKIDRFTDEAKAVDYDAIVIPGGAWNPDFIGGEKNETSYFLGLYLTLLLDRQGSCRRIQG